MAVAVENTPENITESYNFPQWACTKIEKMKSIVKHIELYPDGIQPKQLAREIGLNHNTVKAYLRELESLGIVKRDVYGWYRVVKTTHTLPEPKLQNFVLSYKIPNEREVNSVDTTYDVKIAKLHFTIGKESKQATGHVSAEPPVSVKEAHLISEIFKVLILKEIDYIPNAEEIYFKTVEFNWDYFGIRMDGINCITLLTINGLVEKLYNKPYAVRHEIKGAIPFNSDNLLILLNNGVMCNNVLSSIDMLDKRISNIEKNTSKIGTVIPKLLNIIEKLKNRKEYVN